MLTSSPGSHGMDDLQHDHDLRLHRLRDPREHVAVEVDYAASVGCIREDLGERAVHGGRIFITASPCAFEINEAMKI